MKRFAAVHATLLALFSVSCSASGPSQAGPGAPPSESQPTRQQMRVNDVRLSYVAQGTGPPVVFVHGAFSDERYWEPQREAVAEEYRFIAVTNRYHGTGAWPDDGQQYGAATHAADLAAFVRGLNAGPVHLLGFSAGGVLATLLASEHPDLVRSLILVEPAIGGLLTADVSEAKPVLDDRVATLTAVGTAADAGNMAQAAGLFFDWVNNRGPDALDVQPEPVRRMWLDNARTVPLVLAAPPPSPISCAGLAELRVPTLVVGGAQTRRYFSLIEEIVVRCVPGSRSVVIPDATHFSSYTNPSAFNASVLEFVDGLG
ncbi:MAG: alpha/beta fold hydrolase [Actinomycetota bacterium]